MDRELYEKTFKYEYKQYVEAINNYIKRHEEFYGKKPSDKLIKQYHKLRGITYPLPSEEDYVKERLSKWIKDE